MVKSPFRLLREGSPTAIGILLFAIVLGTFLPCLRYDFVNFDDNVYVYENARVQHGLTWGSVGWAFTTLEGGFWHPLTWVSLLLDYQLFGMESAGYHLTGVLLHAASTALLFALLRHMTGATWRSAFVAALFAVHPLHVEPVAWVSSRKDVLSTFFWMLTLLMYGRYAHMKSKADGRAAGATSAASAPNSQPSTLNPQLPSSAFYLLSLFFFVCGLMSKTMVVTLPFILLLLDWWPLQRLRLKTLFPRFLEKLPFLAASIVCGLLTLRAEEGVGAIPTTAAVTVTDRLANAALSCVRYLGQTFWPCNLAVYYPYPAAFPLWSVAGAVLVLLIISVLLFRAAHRQPYLAFGWIWYGVTLLPVIGLIQVGSHSHADRYTYVPLIGAFIIFAWGANDLTRHWRYQPVILSAAAALFLTLGAALTRHQLSYWKDSETLLRHAIAVTQDNGLMLNNLGAALAGKGRLADAAERFREAVTLNPDGARVHDNLGATLAKQGKLDEASRHLREAIRLDRDCADAHNNLGAILGREGRLDEAIYHLQIAVRLTPRDAGAHCNLGDAFAATGRLDEAISQYREALRLKPDDPETHCNLGVTLCKKGHLEEAIAQFQEALQANPKLANAQGAFAGALLRQGRAAEAKAHYQAAIGAQPGNASFLNNLAWILATCPDTSIRNGARAVELAQQAERLSGGRNPSILGTLAAAFAETGRFPEAIASARQALELAAAQNNTMEAESFRAQLQFYQASAPFRDDSQTNAAHHPNGP